jgi:hypothetical protein
MTWGSSAADAATRRHRTATDWFILGVFISFAGSILDNTFWQLAWTAKTSGAETGWFMAWGPAFNLIFRQLPGIVAAYFHVRASSDAKRLRALQRWLLWSTLGGFAWVAVVFFCQSVGG